MKKKIDLTTQTQKRDNEFISMIKSNITEKKQEELQIRTVRVQKIAVRQIC